MTPKAKGKRDFSKEILDLLSESLHGLTVTDIAEKVDPSISRNTAYRYIERLETKGLVYNKKVGTYNLYYAQNKKVVFKSGIMGFIKGLLANLKNAFPGEEPRFKEFGRNIAESVEIPLTAKGKIEIEKLKDYNDDQILESIGTWVPFFNILFDSANLSNIEIDFKNKKGIYTFDNSEMLEDKDYVYYVYLITGIVERKLQMYTHKDIECKVVEVSLLDIKEESYFKVSLEILS
jgi:predicted transcriptional regulator